MSQMEETSLSDVFFGRSATATGGTVLLEFGLLSRASGLPLRDSPTRALHPEILVVHHLTAHFTHFTGDARYAAAADRAAKALWKRRSQVMRSLSDTCAAPLMFLHVCLRFAVVQWRLRTRDSCISSARFTRQPHRRQNRRVGLL